MKRYIVSIVLILLAFTSHARAQEAKKPYLEGLLQDVLSSPQMQVEVQGLRGTFSSNATVKELTFADELGVWMRIEGAQLVWSRSALLKRRVDIQKLNAEKITLFRLPLSDDPEIKPEATEFRIPKLPVAVSIDEINARTVDLKQSVLGRPAMIRVLGKVNITDGDIKVALKAEHLNGTGSFDLKTSYEKSNLSLDLSVQEKENGIIVSLLGVPNKPAIELTIKGSGPRNAFDADVYLGTQGEERLAGKIIASPIDKDIEGVRLTTDITGDLRPLFDEPYQRFFGEKAQLKATIDRRKNGALRVSEMVLQTARLNATGLVVLSPDATPLRLDIKAEIKDPSNARIILPISGPETSVANARLIIDYTEGEPWLGAVDILDLSQDGLRAKDVKVRGTGAIAPAFLVKSAGDLLISSDLEMTVAGLSHTDVALARALGSRITASGQLNAVKGKPLQISDITFDNTNVQAFLDGQVSGLETALELNGRLEATINDMAKFSGIIDQPIRGRSEITATGGFAFLSGAFDLDIVGTGNGLGIGQRVVDKFLVGANRFTGSVKRNVDGLFIDAARLSNPQISATASGSAKGDQANARIDATLNNAAMLSDALSGPMTLNGTVQRNGALADLDLTTTGVGGLTAKIDGQIPMNGLDWRVTAKGRAPLALADSFVDTSVVTVRGNAEFDLRLSRPKLSGVSGTISTNNAQIILPNQKITLNAVNSNMSIVNGNAKVSATTSESFGGAINASGTVSLSDAQNPTADMVIDIRNLLRKDRTFYSTVLNGTVGFVGPISGGARISGRVDLSSTKVNIAGTGQSTLSFLPSVQHKGQPAAVLQTRKRAGLVVDPSDTQTNSRSRPHLLDLLISAPSKVFVTGRGLNAEFGGNLRLRGTTDNVQPSGFFGLVRGRMNLLGKQFALTSGAITLSGSFDPRIQIEATTTSGEYQTTIVVSGLVSDPEISFRSVPELPEEEVFAQLLFGKGIQQISPFQALQLASALRELSGKRVPSFVRSIRRNLALDDFNINVDEDGSAQVTAGKYVSENVYTDVTIAEDGKSEVTINLDVNKNITVRGAVSESGNSSIGVFFEKDY